MNSNQRYLIFYIWFIYSWSFPIGLFRGLIVYFKLLVKQVNDEMSRRCRFYCEIGPKKSWMLGK